MPFPRACSSCLARPSNLRGQLQSRLKAFLAAKEALLGCRTPTSHPQHTLRGHFAAMAGSSVPPPGPRGRAAPAGSNSRAGSGRRQDPASSPPPVPSSAPSTACGGRTPGSLATEDPTPPLAVPQPSSASGIAAAAAGAGEGFGSGANAANGAGPAGDDGPAPSQQAQHGCTHCGAASSWRWRKHPGTQLRLCSTCWWALLLWLLPAASVLLSCLFPAGTDGVVGG